MNVAKVVGACLCALASTAVAWGQAEGVAYGDLPYTRLINDVVPRVAGFWRLGDSVEPIGDAEDRLVAEDSATFKLAGNPGFYSRDGVLGGFPGPIPSEDVPAARFSGGFVEVPHTNFIRSGTTGTSVEAWVQPELSGAYQAIVSKGEGELLDFELGLDADGSFRFTTQGGAHTVVAPTPANVNGANWFHVVGIHDNVSLRETNVRLYVNGVEVARVPLSVNGIRDESPLLIGNNAVGEAFAGLIANVVLYQLILSERTLGSHFAFREVDGGATGGGQLPFDANQDNRIDIADSIFLIGHLSYTRPPNLPCGMGGAMEAGNTRLMDFDGDGGVALTDALAGIDYQLRAGPPPVLGTACLEIVECPANCAVE